MLRFLVPEYILHSVLGSARSLRTPKSPLKVAPPGGPNLFTFKAMAHLGVHAVLHGFMDQLREELEV